MLVRVNVPLNLKRYGSVMRGVRHPQLSRPVRERGAAEQMRRLGDRVIAGLLLAITSPLIIFVAMAITSESRGPVLVRHTCIGRGGGSLQDAEIPDLRARSGTRATIWTRKTTQVGQFLRYRRI